MNRLQIQLGFILILLALLTPFGMPLFVNTRLGLASHIVGITGGLVLIALGALSASFALGARSAAVMMATWVYAAYANWLACLIGAITGASRLTPIAGAGTAADALSESVVSFLLQSLAVAAIAGTALAVWGFRKPKPAIAASAVAAAQP
ncbi:MAG TPA: hydrogenase [Thermoanaerobaculia bacterium]|nr:hydrogenase [Thermoanaerobaculia bacterium]